MYTCNIDNWSAILPRSDVFEAKEQSTANNS